MTKKEFLKILEKRLAILNEDERKDIINEYRDTISEKVKNGQTEEAAIKDFGDIDELVKELLSAYKLDPDYENKSSFDNILDKSEKGIKKGANKLTELYHRFLTTNKEINLTLVFEILIKLFLVVVALALLRLPFVLFEELGNGIFDAFFSPFDSFFALIWKGCLMVLYLILCILLFIAVFKKYFEKEADNINYQKNIDKTNNSIKKSTSSVPNKENGNHITIGDVFLLILKIWVILFVMIPLVFFDCMALIGLCISVFYFIKGIDLLGLSILLLGGVVLLTYLIKVLYNLIFSKKKITFIPVIVGIVLVVAGFLMFFDMIMNIEYIDKNPYKENITTKEQEFKISHDYFYLSVPYYSKEIIKTVNNNLPDDSIKLKITYDKKALNINFNQDNNYTKENCTYDDFGNVENCTFNTYDYIYIHTENKKENNFQEEYALFIENLKNNKVYNYNYMTLKKVEVIANEKTLKKLSYE